MPGVFSIRWGGGGGGGHLGLTLNPHPLPKGLCQHTATELSQEVQTQSEALNPQPSTLMPAFCASAGHLGGCRFRSPCSQVLCTSCIVHDGIVRHCTSHTFRSKLSMSSH